MGKHRVTHRPSRRRTAVGRFLTPGGLAAAAVGATSLSSALMTGATTAVAPSVDLVALITPANSTSQIFAGTTYYGRDYANPPVYGEQQVVPFFLGPQGIADAISAAGDDGPIVVLSSGWGAGQTGTALGILAKDHDPALDDIDLVILDNNTNRAGGGFWTTYYPFAPLLLTSAEPTPSDLGVPILDVAYEYNINSDAPVDPLNPFALGNSLVAYVYGYGAQQTAFTTGTDAEGNLTLPGENNEPVVLQPGTHYVVSNGVIVDEYPATGTTIYVTVESDGLPLVRPLRMLPGGDIVADALEPTLTQLVDAGYNDGLGTEADPAIPQDPTVVRPMQPGSSLTGLDGVPGAVTTGFDRGAQTARDDLAEPTRFVAKPLDEVSKLPVLSSLVKAPVATTSVEETEEPAPRLEDESPLKTLSVPKRNHTGTSGSTVRTGGQRLSDRINDVVKKVTGGASGGTVRDSGAPSADNESEPD